MKIKNSLLVLAATSTLFVFGTQSYNADASTWYKGTPSEIRGNYKTKPVDVQGTKVTTAYHIYKNSMKLYAHYASNTSFTRLVDKDHHMYYQKIGQNKYKIKFDLAKGQGHFAMKNQTINMTKVGKNLKINKQLYYKF
ncbi:hypothetical protein ACYATP_08145 [Lactobacillaceae bacterium Melli_B4]